MRKALGGKVQRGRRQALSTSISAPVGGWNARDAVANMAPTDAVRMENWFPDTTDVRVRKGYTVYADSLPGRADTLMTYNASDGTQELFAVTHTVDNANPEVPPDYPSRFVSITSDSVTPLQSVGNARRWQYENFTNSAGTNYLVCFSGGYSPQYYDGSTWTSITAVSTPAITGTGSVAQLSYPFAHKRRLFLLKKDSLDLYYLPIDSVGGAAQKLPLGGIATKGGYLVAGGTWTFDGGAGPDDYLVVVTSEGQVIVYSGTNPASDYSLVGVWNLGEPLGSRCLMKYRGDLILIAKDGLWPLSKALQSGQGSPEASLTFKINKAMTDAAVSYGNNFGWETAFFPAANMLLLNVPVQSGARQEQYVMNTITGAWAQFTGIAANTWTIMDGEIYFASGQTIGKFWDTESDAGSPIESDLWQAYSYLGDRGSLKQIKSIRPNIISNGQPSFSAGVNIDFTAGSIATVQTGNLGVGVWGQSKWGASIWGLTLNFYGKWVNANGIGFAVGPRLQTTATNTVVRYQAIDILYEPGTVIA